MCDDGSKWRCVVTAKDVIRGLLKTDPDERLTISEVMQSQWVSVCLDFQLLCSHISNSSLVS